MLRFPHIFQKPAKVALGTNIDAAPPKVGRTGNEQPAFRKGDENAVRAQEAVEKEEKEELVAKGE